MMFAAKSITFVFEHTFATAGLIFFAVFSVAFQNN